MKILTLICVVFALSSKLRKLHYNLDNAISITKSFELSLILGLVEVQGSSSSSSSASSYFGRRLPADSCRGRCQEGVSRDGTCRCDALCELTGSCCDDFLRSCRRSLGKFYNFCFRGIRCRTLIVHTC